ncbi:phage antirepressor [Enterococcus faecalis]|uniref:phage antirepressor KilAC domain-containing protein n=1 Tax=Enterococcus faecalis TaxID=1351 RepID=UPI001026A640|nr:phage antirepressor [Enterococcus faecalis]EGO7729101.1 phage antirepressor [Enterococcus faecalis]EHB5077506.1 phage antirepressor [Enterococcus faecalis]EIX2780539.1 phage antirepressor KilAC domain-containing protein [Enterococcus faecalis]EKD5184905.1 phage antirepressor KilAC domain-containing protein [Enterococcus faecalis]
MNTPQIFNFGQQEVRTMLINEVPYFVANDVAKTLGYKNPSDATNKHCKKAIKTWGSDSLGRRQSFKVIPESDIYRLVIKSNLPNAEQFEEWVMEDVLPQIRKTGSYTNVPSSFAEALRLAADLEEEKMMLEQKVAEYEPKITYLDTILASKDTVTTSQIAADYGMSAIQLNKLLHRLGVQRKVSGQWLLYKKHMNCGYTKSHTSEIKQSNNTVKIVMSTKWTQKGRLFIYNLLKDEGYLPQMDLWDNVS